MKKQGDIHFLSDITDLPMPPSVFLELLPKSIIELCFKEERSLSKVELNWLTNRNSTAAPPVNLNARSFHSNSLVNFVNFLGLLAQAIYVLVLMIVEPELLVPKGSNSW